MLPRRYPCWQVVGGEHGQHAVVMRLLAIRPAVYEFAGWSYFWVFFTRFGLVFWVVNSWRESMQIHLLLDVGFRSWRGAKAGGGF
jgi:hypothetical protein